MFGSPASSALPSASLLNTSVSTRRSLHVTPRGTPSIANRSQRAEQVLEETSRHVVKALNSPVPVQVQETLRGNLNAVSVRLHPCGWAWLVCRNKALLWRYAPVQSSARCHQLNLPSPGSTSAWNADLITICGQTSTTHLSVMATAPSGNVYYWANVLRDRPVPSIDGSVDVGTGHVMMTTPLHTVGVMVMTSESSLFFIPLPTRSQLSLSPRPLHIPRGMLTGFSRRVSSLFFGSSSQEHPMGRSLVASPGEEGDSSSVVFVLTSTSLHKWLVEVDKEQMVYDAAVETILKDSVLHEKWFSGQQVSASVSIWTVDMKLSKGYVVVLFAAAAEGTTVAEYGLALFKAHQTSAPLATDHLIRLNHRVTYQAGGEASLLALALQCAPSSSTAVVHNRNTLLLALATEQGSEVTTDVVTFPPPSAIIGTGHLNSSLLFFTTGQGVVSVALTSPLPTTSSAPLPSSSRLSTLMATPTIPHAHQAPPPELTSEAVEKLKDAFLEYLDGNMSEATSLCLQLFPPETFSLGRDTLGDTAVKELSEMVLNDQPGVDPRWGEGRESASGASLIILYQLENKLTAHNRLIQFVSDSGLMDKLTCVTVRGQPMRTTQLLCEHSEKIKAAIALRRAHNQVVDQAMKQCVQQWSTLTSSRPGLTHQDLFYTEVVRVDDLVPHLLRVMDTRLHSLSHPGERLQVILGAGSALESMLRDAVQYRQSKASLYQPSSPPDRETLPAYLPWTSSPGSSGTRACLSQLLEVIYDTGLRDADTPQGTHELWGLVVGLSDLLLGGYRDQISSMEHNPALNAEMVQVIKHFESARERFLTPLLEHGQYQQAIELGEKYEDFQLLVQLCERAGDRDRLRNYMTRFASQGFAEFLFKQYLDRGELQQLLSYSEDFPRQLAKFLQPHSHLRWLHHLASQEYSKAHRTLYRMAQKEQQSLPKKKTQLSLSKLALLASDSTPDHTHCEGISEVAELNRQLDIVEYQHNIPDSVMEAQGLDLDTMPPLSPREIVELYVSEKNPLANERDFLCALELLQRAFPDKTTDDFKEVRSYIWSQAALRDNWSHMSTDNPLEQLPSTLFFRIVQTAFYEDFELEALLPSLDSLLSSPLLVDAGLAQDTHFRFLVSAGYEHINRIQSTSS